MPRQIIIDTDPGLDDAVALLLALTPGDEIDVIGVIAVAGNIPLDLAEENARKICVLANRREVPVYAGCACPMSGKLITGEDVHGPTGLGDLDLPQATTPRQKQDGIDYLIETLLRSDDRSITIAALGPLTNLAVALIKAPAIVPKIREAVIMGGTCFQAGNITPTAEYNMYVDPQAAAIVLRSGIPITIIPLDVTNSVLSSAARIERVRTLDNHCGKVAAQMLSFFERPYLATYAQDGAPLHDPCVIIYLLRPDLFEGRMVNVEVETTGTLTVGTTVVDWWGITDRPANAQYLMRVDAEACYDIVINRLSRLP